MFSRTITTRRSVSFFILNVVVANNKIRVAVLSRRRRVPCVVCAVRPVTPAPPIIRITIVVGGVEDNDMRVTACLCAWCASSAAAAAGTTCARSWWYFSRVTSEGVQTHLLSQLASTPLSAAHPVAEALAVVTSGLTFAGAAVAHHSAGSTRLVFFATKKKKTLKARGGVSFLVEA